MSEQLDTNAAVDSLWERALEVVGCKERLTAQRSMELVKGSSRIRQAHQGGAGSWNIC
jgi:hypothetical protein